MNNNMHLQLSKRQIISNILRTIRKIGPIEALATGDLHFEERNEISHLTAYKTDNEKTTILCESLTSDRPYSSLGYYTEKKTDFVLVDRENAEFSAHLEKLLRSLNKENYKHLMDFAYFAKAKIETFTRLHETFGKTYSSYLSVYPEQTRHYSDCNISYDCGKKLRKSLERLCM